MGGGTNLTISTTATDIAVAGSVRKTDSVVAISLNFGGIINNITIAGWSTKKIGVIANWPNKDYNWQALCAPLFSSLDGSFGGNLSINASGEIEIVAISSVVTLKAGHIYIVNCAKVL